MKEVIRNWVMYDDKHVIDTNTGIIVLKEKQHDFTIEDVKGYDKLDIERLWDVLDLAYRILVSMSTDSEAKTNILRSIRRVTKKIRELN